MRDRKTPDANNERARISKDWRWSRLFALSLYLYPADFREVYGSAMTCVFEETLQETRMRSGFLGVLRLLLYTAFDLVKSAGAERVRDILSACGIERQSSLGISLAVHGVLAAGIIWAGIHRVPMAPSSCNEHEITGLRHSKAKRAAIAEREEQRGFATVMEQIPSHSGQRY